MLLSVFTSGNVLQKPTSRTRLCALKFSDRPDARTDFLHGLIERLRGAKGRRRQNFGFDVRSVTFAVESDFLWVVLIGLTALSFSKWHRIFVRVEAVDMKVVCIHRHGKIGTQTSLETAADLLGSMTSLQDLARNEIVCDIDEETLAKAAGKRRGEASGKRRADTPASDTRPVDTRPADTRPADTQALQPADTQAAGKRRKPSPPAEPDQDLVQECLAFLTSREMPPIEPHHARLLQHALDAGDHGQIGAFLLSQRPLELFARVVHLRMAVLRALRDVYGVDTRGSLGTSSLLDNDGYQNIPHERQSALRMISKCMDNARDFPVFAFLDMVRPCLPASVTAMLTLGAGEYCHAGQPLHRPPSPRAAGRRGPPPRRLPEHHTRGERPIPPVLPSRA